MQLLFPRDCTSEEYLKGKIWLKVDPPACPFCKAPSGDGKPEPCGLIRHGVYARVEPEGTLIRRFRCPRTGRTVSLLPTFLLSHCRGRVKPVEDLAVKVESRQREQRRRTGKRLPQFALAEWLRPEVGLAGGVRWLRPRLRVVRLFLLGVRSLYPQHCPPSPQAGVSEFRVLFGTGRVLAELRRLAECELHGLPRPLGLGPFKKCAAPGGEPRQHKSGLDPPARGR